jgi:hypothetical protein
VASGWKKVVAMEVVVANWRPIRAYRGGRVVPTPAGVRKGFEEDDDE